MESRWRSFPSVALSRGSTLSTWSGCCPMCPVVTGEQSLGRQSETTYACCSESKPLGLTSLDNYRLNQVSSRWVQTGGFPTPAAPLLLRVSSRHSALWVFLSPHCSLSLLVSYSLPFLCHLLSESLWHVLVFFELFLTFWHNRMPQAHRVPSLASPGISQLSKEPWFSLVSNGM